MDIENARQKAENLREQILYHNDRYYNQDSPEISDYEYDALMRELKAAEKWAVRQEKNFRLSNTLFQWKACMILSRMTK